MHVCVLVYNTCCAMEGFSLIKIISVAYFAILLCLAGQNIFNGALTQLMQNQTKIIENNVPSFEFEPMLTLCRMPGFKFNENYENMIQDSADGNGNFTLIRANVFKPDDLIKSTVIQRNVINYDPKHLDTNFWTSQYSDNMFLGNCFKINLAEVRANCNYTEWKDMSTIIKIGEENTSVNLSSYFIQSYTPDLEALAGFMSLRQAEMLMYEVKPYHAMMYNIILKKVKRMWNCNPDPSYNFSQCLWKYLAEKSGGCTIEEMKNVECSLSQIGDFGNMLLELKLNGYKRLITRTGCLLPCEQRVYELEKMAVARNSDVFKDLRPTETRIFLRFIYEETIKELQEVKAYNFSMFFSDLGGSLGLFLGISFWTLWEWSVKIMPILFKRITK